MANEIPGLTQAAVAAKSAEDAAKSAALAQLNKQESWVRANRKALIVGAAIAFIAGLLLGLTACSTAQSGTLSATLTWNAVTQNTDGTPVVAPVSYNVYEGAKGAEAATPVATGVATTTWTATTGLSPGATVCFEVTAVSGAGIESAKSNESCKTFAPEVPNPPTNLTVQ